MRLHYRGKYSGNPDDLPLREHPVGAVMFREPGDPAALAREAAKFAVAAFLPALVLFTLTGGYRTPHLGICLLLGAMLATVTAPLHELLHALCFREEVYLYTNLKQGMLFVIGPEDMSRRRFIAMSLLPNVVLGLLPLAAGLLWPKGLAMLACMGLIALPMGAGDYLNAWNAWRQVPRNGLVYLSGFHSYWYVR